MMPAYLGQGFTIQSGMTMGVCATYCQLCGLPVQHDHYVPSASGGLRIYRGTSDAKQGWTAEERQPFPFGSEHAWLLDAVGVPYRRGEVVRGQVTDGGLAPQGNAKGSAGGLFVGDGQDEALALHHACWELMGRPGTAAEALTGRGAFGWAQVQPYQEQLFEFEELVADGLHALLADPRGDTADAKVSRARIEALLGPARTGPRQPPLPTTVAEAIAKDRDWHAHSMRGGDFKRQHLVRHRRFGPLEAPEHPELLCRIRELPEGPLAPEHVGALMEYEARLKATLEADGLGILVMTTLSPGQAQWVGYVGDLAEAHRRIEALPLSGPGESGYDDAHDPEWQIFFEMLAAQGV